MLKSYDTECKECGQIVEQFLEDEESLNPCPICGNDMRRIFTTMNFKLIYDPKTQMCGWAFNNYNHNRYWDDFRRERYHEGKDVRPLGEDP